MNRSHRTKWRASLLTGALVCLMAPYARAQQNPFESLKDALNKAKQQLQQTTATTSATGTSAQTPGAAPAAPSPAAGVPVTPAPSNTTTPTAAVSTGVFVPPSDDPTKPTGPLNPAKLLDIGGIHIGMPIATTVPILQKIHPEAKLTPDTAVNGEPMAAYRISLYTPHPPPSDDIWVNYTFDTLDVYSVSRAVGYLPQVNKSTLVEALRKKYGPETAAMSGNYAPKNDSEIDKMWWLSDEQGNVIHPANISNMTYTPYGCTVRAGFGYDVVTNYRSAFRDLQGGKLAAATFCDSVIILYIEVSNGSSGGHNDPTLVSNTRSMLFDSALFRRSTIAWAHRQASQAQQQQQQALQKANQAKPNL